MNESEWATPIALSVPVVLRYATLLSALQHRDFRRLTCWLATALSLAGRGISGVKKPRI